MGEKSLSWLFIQITLGLDLSNKPLELRKYMEEAWFCHGIALILFPQPPPIAAVQDMNLNWKHLSHELDTAVDHGTIKTL